MSAPSAPLVLFAIMMLLLFCISVSKWIGKRARSSGRRYWRAKRAGETLPATLARVRRRRTLWDDMCDSVDRLVDTPAKRRQRRHRAWRHQRSSQLAAMRARYVLSSYPEGGASSFLDDLVPALPDAREPVPRTGSVVPEPAGTAPNLTEIITLAAGQAWDKPALLRLLGSLRTEGGKHVWSGNELHALFGGNKQTFLHDLKAVRSGVPLEEPQVEVTPIAGRQVPKGIFPQQLMSPE